MLQMITPDQRIVLLKGLEWLGNHVIIPIAIWGYTRLRAALRAEKKEIIGQITSSVQNEVNSRIAAHEQSDVEMFNRINSRLDTMSATVQSINGQLKGLQSAFEVVAAGAMQNNNGPARVQL